MIVRPWKAYYGAQRRSLLIGICVTKTVKIYYTKPLAICCRNIIIKPQNPKEGTFLFFKLDSS